MSPGSIGTLVPGAVEAGTSNTVVVVSSGEVVDSPGAVVGATAGPGTGSSSAVQKLPVFGGWRPAHVSPYSWYAESDSALPYSSSHASMSPA